MTGVAYAVSFGSYSDYGVQGIFATKELAEEFAAKMNAGGGNAYSGDSYAVEEFPYYEEIPKIHLVWHARQGVWDDGRTRTTEMYVSSHAQLDEPGKFHVRERPDWGSDRKYSGDVYATGPDRDRVIKAVADRIARLRAEREGVA